MKIFRTPKDGLNFVMLTFLFGIILPFTECLNLYLDYENGRFDTHADSIGLGFAQIIFTAVIFAPVVLGLVIWIVCKYPAETPFFGYNTNRSFRSFVWTLIFGFLICEELAIGILNVFQGEFIGAFQNISFIYCGLLFRAAIVYRGEKDLRVLP